MICQACQRPARFLLCRGCAIGLRPASERLVAGGIRVVAAFEHEGPARVLVHNLKYRGVRGYPDLVASVLAPHLPALPLVPVPRALSRRLRYGVDPAAEVARSLATLSGAPVVRMLASPWHTRRRAGSDHRRPVATFRVRGPVSDRVVVVDDVVTTGATVEAAVRSLGACRVALVVAANSAKGGV